MQGASWSLEPKQSRSCFLRAELSVSNTSTTKSHVIFYRTLLDRELEQGPARTQSLQPPTVVANMISEVLLEAGISDERQSLDSAFRASPNWILKVKRPMIDDPPTFAPNP
jgi:hypothetical protein